MSKTFKDGEKVYIPGVIRDAAAGSFDNDLVRIESVVGTTTLAFERSTILSREEVDTLTERNLGQRGRIVQLQSLNDKLQAEIHQLQRRNDSLANLLLRAQPSAKVYFGAQSAQATQEEAPQARANYDALKPFRDIPQNASCAAPAETDAKPHEFSEAEDSDFRNDYLREQDTLRTGWVDVWRDAFHASAVIHKDSLDDATHQATTIADTFLEEATASFDLQRQ